MVLGTLVSQTLLNLVALAILGAIMFSSVDFFNGHQDALLLVAILPAVLLLVVLVLPRCCVIPPPGGSAACTRSDPGPRRA